MTRALINFDAQELKAVDAAARRLGLSRSAFVRRAAVTQANPASRPETPEERRTRIMSAFERLRESGRRIRKINPDWDPIALIRASRDGKIRL